MIVATMTVAILCASLHMYYYKYYSIEPKYLQQNLIVEGKVSSLSDDSDRQDTTQNLVLSLSKIGKTSLRYSLRYGTKVRLSWFEAPVKLRQGQKVRLLVSMKKPQGLANKHSFDRQKWLLSNYIVATGYVKNSATNQVIDHSVSFRQDLVNRLNLVDLSQMRWIQALVLGNKAQFSQADYALLQNTGVAHLFAISGMHLSIVFGFTYLLAKQCFGLIFRLFPTVHITSLKPYFCSFAILMSFVYSAMAGFQIPVVRAFLFITCLCILTFMNRHWRPLHYLLVCIVAFLIITPMAHYSLSFWFSFVAVVGIYVYLWRCACNNKNRHKHIKYYVYELIKLQLFLSAVTLPITWSVFGSVPIFSLFANLLLIPLVSLVLVPYCLVMLLPLSLSFVDASLLYYCLVPLDWAFNGVLWFLSLFPQDAFEYAEGFELHSSDFFLLSICLVCWLLPNKRLALFLFFGIFLLKLFVFGYFNLFIEKPIWHIHAFDVGQGSAIALEKDNRFLLYDTGASVDGRFSMAYSVLLPFFKAKGVNELDTVVISHFDNDHSGGLKDLESNLELKRILSPNNHCFKGQNFVWQGLNFEILWPLNKRAGQHNNDSCVIRISDHKHSVLLTGDIESSIEKALVSELGGEGLSADIMFAPHHGSKSSSTPAFIKAVKPNTVIFNAGYKNRWGFPHKNVVDDYRQAKAKMYQTGLNGQITINFYSSHFKLIRYLQDDDPSWYTQRNTDFIQ